jgi:hypothetical protein
LIVISLVGPRETDILRRRSKREYYDEVDRDQERLQALRTQMEEYGDWRTATVLRGGGKMQDERCRVSGIARQADAQQISPTMSGRQRALTLTFPASLSRIDEEKRAKRRGGESEHRIALEGSLESVE